MLIIIHLQKDVENWYVWQGSMMFCCLQKMCITYCVTRANVLLDCSFMMTSKILLFTTLTTDKLLHILDHLCNHITASCTLLI